MVSCEGGDQLLCNFLILLTAFTFIWIKLLLVIFMRHCKQFTQLSCKVPSVEAVEDEILQLM